MEYLLYSLVVIVIILLAKSFLRYHLYTVKMRNLYLKHIRRGLDNPSALKEISRIRHPELSNVVHEELASKFDELGALINFIYWGLESHLLKKQEFTDKNALLLIEAGRVVLQGQKYRVIIDKDNISSQSKG